MFGGERQAPRLVGDAALPSRYAVTELACATISGAAQALADLSEGGPTDGAVVVDRRLASLWFDHSAKAVGWEQADVWDAVAGNYRASDGWIRLHTNAPLHRAAALSVLGCPAERGAVEKAVALRRADDLEASVVADGGAAARLRSHAAWAAHPQGAAVAAEPLVIWDEAQETAPRNWHLGPAPLSGLRVLDLTRVLAGPVATRFLAGFGADVLRIDPPGWDEPSVLPDVALGKRCAGLDLSDREDRSTFERLLKEADVLVHGYRPGVLDALGFDGERRRTLNPGVIEVSLSAYGHSGPWARRRGFDSLVQMSSGIAAPTGEGQSPHPLPVQALDHGTGYLMAACVLVALKSRAAGRVRSARLSLARTGETLAAVAGTPASTPVTHAEADWLPEIEASAWGTLRRLRPPVRIGALEPQWDRPASRLRTAAPIWRPAG